MPAHTDGIAQVQQVKQLKSLLPDNVPSHVNLDFLSRSLEMGEPRLAHQSIRDHAPGNPHFALVRFQFRTARLSVLLYQRSRRIRPAKFTGIRIMSQRLDLFEFLVALFKLVARLKLQRENPFGSDGV